ncbi:hypothetical protein JZ751_022647, partial [Albula glossodonta]
MTFIGNIDLSSLNIEEAALIQQVVERNKAVLKREEDRQRKLNDAKARQEIQKTKQTNESGSSDPDPAQPSTSGVIKNSIDRPSKEDSKVKDGKDNGDTKPVPTRSSLRTRFTSFFSPKKKNTKKDFAQVDSDNTDGNKSTSSDSKAENNTK